MATIKTRGFSEDLWDKFESVVKKVDNGKIFTASMSKFLMKQQQIESNYAKSMIKLCRDKSFAPDMEMGTLRDSFQLYREQLEVIGLLHEDFSQKLERIIQNGLEAYIEESRKQRKALVASGERLTKDLKTSEANESRAKQNYEKLKRKQEEALEDLAKQPPGAKEQKSRKNLESVTKAADKADNEYKDSVKVLQQNQNKFYHEEMPKILDDLQKFESERIEKTRDWLMNITQESEVVPPIVISSYDKIKGGVNSIDMEKDIQTFIMVTMSGAQKPPEAQYEPYQPSNNHLSFTALSSPISGNSPPQVGENKNGRKSNELSTSGGAVGNGGGISASTSSTQLSISSNNDQPNSPSKDGSLNSSKEFETVRALYDYVATEDNEISFKANNIIKVIQRDESGWWQGSIVGGDNKVGMFPSNFVESTDSQKKKVDVAGGKCKVLYDYHSDCDGELEIKEGEVLTIEYEDEGWFFGINDKGGSGRFPSNYVQMIK
eukprot:gene1087-1378_t